MATLRDLILATSSLVKASGKRRDFVNPTAGMKFRQFIPIPPIEGLGIQYTFAALTGIKHSKFYVPTIMFYNVDFVDKKDSDHPKGLEVVPGVAKYYAKPSLSKSEVQVVCQCDSYKFEFGYYNRAAGDDFGNYNYNYTRVSPPSGLPPVNPQQTPGLCKHIIRMSRDLKERGVILP